MEERGLGKRNSIKAGAIVRAQKSPDRPSIGRVYTLRGRVRCGMCGHRMEGSHQKGSNWYRCQYARRRSQAAATHADHPQVLGIKEEKVLEAALDFLARRVFGPDRLRLLRDELADATASTWENHAADLDRHESELRDIERSLRVQALRLEEHEDPKHPVVVLATERIEELSARKSGVTTAIDALKAKRPAGHHPDEIAAMLDAVPDLLKALKTASDEQLADIFGAFDVTVRKRPDKPAARTRRDHHTRAIAPKRPRPLRGTVAGTRSSGGGIETQSCDRVSDLGTLGLGCPALGRMISAYDALLSTRRLLARLFRDERRLARSSRPTQVPVGALVDWDRCSGYRLGRKLSAT